MGIQWWQCCDKNKAMMPKAKCRVCGKSKPDIGFKDEPVVRPKRVDKPTDKESLSVRRSRDKHIGPDDAPAVSTMCRQ